MKPKNNYAGVSSVSSVYDRCQTPPYGVEPLFKFIKPDWKIWEPAVGDGILAATLRKNGFTVTGTDINKGTNFFACEKPAVEVIITNPPYSIKYGWMLRCCELNIPFALLVPVEMIGAATAQKLIKDFDLNIEIILTDKRIDFKMPNTSWEKSNAQFPTMWLTSGFGIGHQITFVELNKPNKAGKAELDSEIADLLSQYGSGT